MTGTARWKRADTPEKLLALVTYAEQNAAHDAADTIYSEAIRLAPQNRAADAGCLRVALTRSQWSPQSWYVLRFR